MYLYTLSKRFIPMTLINDFVSAIWTERYSSAGDFQIVLEASPETVDMLMPGRFVGLQGTKEIMIAESHSIENGLLTVSGSSITAFLNNRQANFPGDDNSYTVDNTSAGEFIADVVEQTVITPAYFDYTHDKLTGLALGRVTDTGTTKRLTVGSGPLYDAIRKVAEDEGVGFKMYLESAVYSTGYVLKFTTWLGKLRTRDQDDNRLIRLSPKFDSLTDVKELTSIAEYKNVIYVAFDGTTTYHYAEPSLGMPIEFARRVVYADAPSIYIDPGHNVSFREQVARNTMGENQYVQAVDGQASTEISYKFGQDYYLGDIVELEGTSGLITKARVSEYIRSADQFGDREYPTLAVIDPLFTGYIPDVEPTPVDPDPPGDPDYVLDDPDPDDPDHKRKKRRKKDPNPDPEPPFPPRTPPGDHDNPDHIEIEPDPGTGDRIIYDPSPPGATNYRLSMTFYMSVTTSVMGEVLQLPYMFARCQGDAFFFSIPGVLSQTFRMEDVVGGGAFYEVWDDMSPADPYHEHKPEGVGLVHIYSFGHTWPGKLALPVDISAGLPISCEAITEGTIGPHPEYGDPAPPGSAWNWDVGMDIGPVIGMAKAQLVVLVTYAWDNP